MFNVYSYKSLLVCVCVCVCVCVWRLNVGGNNYLTIALVRKVARVGA